VWNDMVGDMEERTPTTLKELSQRVTDLAATLARDTHEMYVRVEDAQDDRALQRARFNMLFRDRRYHLHTTMLLESEVKHAQQAWLPAMDCNRARMTLRRILLTILLMTRMGKRPLRVDDDEEDNEHLALANSSTAPIDDPFPSAEETEPFKTEESAPTPPSPRLQRARIPVRPQTPMVATTEALIAAVAVALPSSSPPPSPLTPLSSLLSQIPSSPLPLPSPPLPLPVPSSPLLLPATDRREDVPEAEADVPPQKRLCLTAPAPSFVDTMDATHGRPMSREVGYRITDVWNDMVGDMEERAPTTLEELSQRVTDLAATLARDTHEMYVRVEDAQDDRALQRARFNMLFRDRRYHLHTSMLLESEAKHAQQAWLPAMDCNRAVHTELLAYRAEGHSTTREPEPARDLEPDDGPTTA
nr:hypothetical protein [Tanacetum cinerariifolium]